MTELAPGMMVECIYVIESTESKHGFLKGNKYFVEEVKIGPFGCLMCNNLHSGVEILNMPPSKSGNGWSACAFKPIGGDKEIEKEEYQKIKPKLKIYNVKSNDPAIRKV